MSGLAIRCYQSRDAETELEIDCQPLGMDCCATIHITGDFYFLFFFGSFDI